ncbi:CHASE2 domain-containing protein [candidate division KSB1 bacterium]|nr:CHASE2 domain-containing protein [candidate division KSB1 bacterium]
MPLAKTHIAKTLEIASLDHRFVYRGESNADSNIVVVLWDDSSAAKLELGPKFRETTATLIKGLAKMQTRVIAVDFFFEEKKAPFSDSLLCAAFAETPNTVTAFFHRKVTEHDDSFATPAQKILGINEYRGFFRGGDGVKLMPGLRHPRVRVGHATLLDDTVTTEVRSLPFYITSDSTRAAFALEIVKINFGITDQQIKVINGKLVLFPAGREPIRIPINKFGEYEINYLGADNVFARRHSLYDVYNLCRNAIADSARQVENRDFKDKIVLIGSIIDDDIFVTPFSDFVPGVFVHATVVDNILREQFLVRLPRGSGWAILFVVGALLFWLFSKCKLATQSLGVILILAGYTALTFVLFDRALIVTPLVLVVDFVLLSSAMQGVNLHLAALRRQKMIKRRIRDIVEARTQLMLQKQISTLTPSPHYFFAIDSREDRDEYTFIHWLKFVDIGNRGIAPFEPEIKVSLPVHRNEINKLEHDIQKLWQRYAQGIEAAEKRTVNLGEELKKIGTRIANDFGLKPTFAELFDNNHASLPLKLAVTDLRIPWHWAFSQQAKGFLCESYSVAFTFFDSEKEQLPKPDRPEPKHNPDKAAGRMAVLFYGDWQGHPQKQLNHVRGQIIKLQEQLTWQDCSTLVVREKCQDFLNRLTKACAEGCNLRLIHYAGHAEQGFLDVGKDDYLKSNTISGKLGLSFPSRPLVFLNACSSGRLPEKWDKMENLCTEFLACGAGACIVTNFDVYEKTAGRFAQIFYDHFVAQNLTAGEALQLTINELGKPDKKHDYDPDYDITRYFYTLYGDPTMKF